MHTESAFLSGVDFPNHMVIIFLVKHAMFDGANEELQGDLIFLIYTFFLYL